MMSSRSKRNRPVSADVVPATNSGGCAPSAKVGVHLRIRKLDEDASTPTNHPTHLQQQQPLTLDVDREDEYHGRPSPQSDPMTGLQPLRLLKKEGTHSYEQRNSGRGSQQGSSSHVQKAYGFDRVHWPWAEQEDVYKSVGPQLLDHSLAGYNTCLLAYGQTGSGKTYTMTGPSVEVSNNASFTAGGGGRKAKQHRTEYQISGEAAGFIPRFCADLFDRVNQATGSEEEPSGCSQRWKVSVGYLELYNEDVRDLLNDGEKLEGCRRDGTVIGQKFLLCESYDQLMVEFLQGSAHRHTSKTKMNHRSSRSHAILQIKLQAVLTVENARPVTKANKKSQLQEKSSSIFLVDLAGSERVKDSGVQDQQFKEAVKINSSLLVLGRVLEMLSRRGHRGHAASRHQHNSDDEILPIRESTLTTILQHAFGGNALTTLMATVTAEGNHWDETRNTLDKASLGLKITNCAVVNEDPKTKQLKQYKRTIDDLQARLAELETAQVDLDGNQNFSQSEMTEAALEEFTKLQSEKEELDERVQFILNERECFEQNFQEENKKRKNAEEASNAKDMRIDLLVKENSVLRAENAKVKEERDNYKTLYHKSQKTLKTREFSEKASNEYRTRRSQRSTTTNSSHTSHNSSVQLSTAAPSSAAFYRATNGADFFEGGGGHSARSSQNLSGCGDISARTSAQTPSFEFAPTAQFGRPLPDPGRNPSIAPPLPAMNMYEPVQQEADAQYQQGQEEENEDEDANDEFLIAEQLANRDKDVQPVDHVQGPKVVRSSGGRRQSGGRQSGGSTQSVESEAKPLLLRRKTPKAAGRANNYSFTTPTTTTPNDRMSLGTHVASVLSSRRASDVNATSKGGKSNQQYNFKTPHTSLNFKTPNSARSATSSTTSTSWATKPNPNFFNEKKALGGSVHRTPAASPPGRKGVQGLTGDPRIAALRNMEYM